VHSYKTEGEMLRAWSEFFRLADADIVTGYNIANFDLPYLIGRAQTLKVADFALLGRLRWVCASRLMAGGG
jgi:DNA polymerase delta subunit 1